MKEQNQSAKIRTYFDELSGIWRTKYRPGEGGMAERIPLFKNALLAVSKTCSDRVLDFGCGSGVIAQALKESGFEVVGCDLSLKMLEEARRCSDKNSFWVASGCLKTGFLPFRDASFDGVMASGVFEYLDEPQRYLEEFCRILNSGGHLFITVPDSSHRIRKNEKIIIRGMSLLKVQYFMRFLPKKIAHYFQYLSLSKQRYEPNHWCRLFKDSGFIPSILRQDQSPTLLIRGDKA